MASTASSPNLADMLQLALGEPIQDDEIDDSICFLAAIVLVLVGTIYVDGEIDDEEKQHFYRVLRQFFPKERFGELTQKVVQGTLKHKLFRQTTAFQLCTESFSISERLLVVSFGYQISASDGEMHAKELKYLQKIGQLLNLEIRYLSIFERGFLGLPIEDQLSLQQVRHWLDPVRFQALDTVFVEAASFMEEHLPEISSINALVNTSSNSLISLNLEEAKQESASLTKTSELSFVAFQDKRDRLIQIHQRLHDTLTDLYDRTLLPKPLLDDSEKVVQRLRSSTFRVAVVGEFSKGKSTLLNALLGRDIQPVSNCPCSGVISVLRYGEVPRLLCCYTDGTQTQISLDEYSEKATIPKTEALAGHTVKALLNNPINHLIFESPELEFCKNGIEIVDSPGLNEHPNRTAVTQAILKKTDAVIILLSAMQLLTQSERELVQEIATQVLSGHGAQTLSGVFAVVNFIDTLDEDEPEALADLKSRTENFFLGGEMAFVPSSDRLHYLSAKQALKAKKSDITNVYRSSFDEFVESLEQFLTCDRGTLQLAANIEVMNRLIDVTVTVLENDLLRKEASLQDVMQEQKRLIELIGNTSGRALKVREDVGELLEELDAELPKCFDQWWEEKLFNQLAEKRQKWSCDKSSIFDRDKVVAYAAQQFKRDFAHSLQDWLTTEAVPDIIKPMFGRIEDIIKYHITAIQSELSDVEQGSNSLSSSFVWAFNDLDFQNVDDDNVNAIGGFGGVALAAAAIALPGILLPIIVGSLVGGFGLGTLIGFKDSVFDAVFKNCCTTLGESLDPLYDSLIEQIICSVTAQLDEFDESIEKILAMSYSRLEQIDRAASASSLENEQDQKVLKDQLEVLKIIRQDIEKL